MNTGRTSATAGEVASQPDVWPDALAAGRAAAGRVRGLLPSSGVRFTGCGSSYYLAEAVRRKWSDIRGIETRVAPGSLLWLQDPERPTTVEGEMLVAVSRSGRTSEVLNAIASHRERGGGTVVAATCAESSPLEEGADLTLKLPFAMEDSLAQTRSFTSIYLALLAIAVEMAEEPDLSDGLDRLPDSARSVLKEMPAALEGLAGHATDRIYVLGNGVAFDFAREGAMKTKEMSLTHSEAFHFLEFRHGPISMVTPSAVVVGLATPQPRDLFDRVLRGVLDDAGSLGAKILNVAPGYKGFPIDAALPAAIADILYLLPMQLLALRQAEVKGLDPDKPRNLSAFVNLSNGP